MQIEEDTGAILAAPAGTITPGRFDYKQKHVPCVGTLEFTEVPVGDERMAGDTVVVAAHATVTDRRTEEEIVGAWAGAQDFGVPGDATYFEYTLAGSACGGDGSCLVFVTSQGFLGGELGGLSGADSECQEEADAAGEPGTYKAWLADDTDSPRGRFTQADVPYVLVDGSQVAANFDALVDGDVDADVIMRLDGTVVCDPAFQGCVVWSAVDVATGGYRAGAPTRDRWADRTFSGDGTGAVQPRVRGDWGILRRGRE